METCAQSDPFIRAYSGQAAPHRTGKPPRWTCPGPGEMLSGTGTLDGFGVRNLRSVGDQI